MTTQLAKNSLPIGIFDSGMGGLTVLRELKKHLPNESFVYLGDTARLPYGTKSPETVKRYALQMANLLGDHHIKLMVVACNTATATALPYLQQQFPDITIIGVVEPGARAAVAATNNNHVAVLATETTINAGIYQQTLRQLNSDINVVTQSCGLFVALAEEGCIDDEVALAVAKKYLTPIQQDNHCDCVVLGCTHFPVLINSLRSVLGDDVNIVNSATATAETVQTTLQQLNLNNQRGGSLKFFVTDLPERFIRVGAIFLGETINPDDVRLVDLSHQVPSDTFIADRRHDQPLSESDTP